MANEGSFLLYSFLSIFSFLLSFSLRQLPCTHANGVRKFDTIYQFGDSISDTGNFKRITNGGCGSLPYGQTIGIPTGRCSDGLLIVDFTANRLGLPLLNPYLDTNAEFSNGVNFAVGGATALSAAALEAKNVMTFVPNASLPVELSWFQTHLKSICSSPSKSCQARLSKSLFFLGEIGGNDINFSLLQGKSFQFVYSLIPEVVQAISNAVQEVIDVGAKYILVPGNVPIGCVPLYRLIFATNDTSSYDNLNCLKSFNDVVQFQNDQIEKAVIQLQNNNRRVHIEYVDLYNAYKSLIVNADLFGFEKDLKQCCGNSTINCGVVGAPVCANPRTRISWDDTHPSQQANMYMTRYIFAHTSLLK